MYHGLQSKADPMHARDSNADEIVGTNFMRFWIGRSIETATIELDTLAVSRLQDLTSQISI